MKRNMESASESSDEEKTSLKKAKKENFGKGENSESDNTETLDGSNSIYNSDRSGKDCDCDKDVEEDTNGSSKDISDINLSHELHSGREIGSNHTFIYNSKIINGDTKNELISCGQSVHIIQMENKDDRSVKVGSSNCQSNQDRNKESSRGNVKDGINQEIIPSELPLIDQKIILEVFGNSSNAEGNSTTRRRSFCCSQRAYNSLLEDIDECNESPKDCLCVQSRNDQNDSERRKEIGEVILSSQFCSRNDRNIDAFHNYNGGTHDEKDLIDCASSTYNHNSISTGRTFTIYRSNKERKKYDTSYFGESNIEINQNFFHPNKDQSVDTSINGSEAVDGGPSNSRLFLGDLQNSFNCLEGMDYRWGIAPCSSQNVQYRNDESDRCDDNSGMSVEICDSHSHEHVSSAEVCQTESITEGNETAARSVSTGRVVNYDREVFFEFHSLDEDYISSDLNIGRFQIVEDCEVEIIGSNRSEDSSQSEEFHSFNESERDLNDENGEVANGDEAGDYDDDNDDNSSDDNSSDDNSSDVYSSDVYSSDVYSSDVDSYYDDYDSQYESGDYDFGEDEYLSAEDEFIAEESEGETGDDGYLTAQDIHFSDNEA